MIPSEQPTYKFTSYSKKDHIKGYIEIGGQETKVYKTREKLKELGKRKDLKNITLSQPIDVKTGKYTSSSYVVISATKDLSNKQSLGRFLAIATLGIAYIFSKNVRDMWAGEKAFSIAILDVSRKEQFSSNIDLIDKSGKKMILSSGVHHSKNDSYTKMVDEFMKEYYSRQLDKPTANNAEIISLIKDYFNNLPPDSHPQLLALFFLYELGAFIDIKQASLTQTEKEDFTNFLLSKLEKEALMTIHRWGGRPREILIERTSKAIDELIKADKLSMNSLKDKLGFNIFDLRDPKRRETLQPEISNMINKKVVPYLIEKFKKLPMEEKIKRYDEMSSDLGPSTETFVNACWDLFLEALINKFENLPKEEKIEKYPEMYKLSHKSVGFADKCRDLFLEDLKIAGNFRSRFKLYQEIPVVWSDKAMELFVDDIDKTEFLNDKITIYNEISKEPTLNTNMYRATEAIANHLYDFYKKGDSSIDEKIAIYEKVNIPKLPLPPRVTEAFLDSLAPQLAALRESGKAEGKAEYLEKMNKLNNLIGDSSTNLLYRKIDDIIK